MNTTKKNYWKGIVAVLLILAFAFSFAACSPKNTENKIVIWTWDQDFNGTALNAAKEIYKGINPDVQVEVVILSQDDVVQKLNTFLSSGTSDGLPDIVLVEDYNMNGYLKAYPNAFKDLSQIIDTNNFMSFKLDSITMDNKVYGVPFDIGVTGTFYRTDLIEAAGFTKEDMADLTWDKYIEIGKAVKEKTGAYMIAIDPGDMMTTRIMMQSGKEWYVKDDGVTLNIKDNVALKQSLKIYKDMVDAGIVYTVSDWENYVSSANKGTVATIVSGYWMIPSIKQEEAQSGKWAVAPTPKLTDDSSSTSNVGGATWCVLSKGKNPEIAADFLAKTFGYNTDLANTLVDKIGLISALKAAKETSNYQKEDAFFGNQKIYANFSEWSSSIPGVNYGADTYEIDDIVKLEIPNLLSGKPIDEILASIENKAKLQLVN